MQFNDFVKKVEHEQEYTIGINASSKKTARLVASMLGNTSRHEQDRIASSLRLAKLKVDVQLSLDVAKWERSTGTRRVVIIASVLQVLRDRELNKALSSSALASAAMSGVSYSGKGLAG
jgi:hypothetical protein